MRAEASQGTVPGDSQRLSLRGLGVFTALVALLAILSDAAIGHALLWENDPYWTYWITKTFLIATVFGLGTAWLGVGAGRGAVITAIHTLVLTIYYWSLSPIGLPSHTEWLDLEHTWVTGLPVHFGVIYLGYLLTLWLWRRRAHAETTDSGDVRPLAVAALVTGAGIVAIAGALESLALWEFPGVTWFIVRLLIVVPFILVWWATAGRTVLAGIVGAITLALILISYSHFLGPIGLPDGPPRIFERAAPGATVEWLSYRSEFLVAFPITIVVAVAAFVLSSSRPRTVPAAARRLVGPAVIALAVILGAGLWVATATEADDERATLEAAGPAAVERGAFYGSEFQDGSATLQLQARNVNPRVTPLPPHDELRVEATIEHPDGSTYVVRSRQPLVDDPRGRFTTWWGVGIDVWHHGRSGVGSDRLPATFSEIAIFGVGEVTQDGETIAAGVPVHVMTNDGEVELDVGDETTPIPELPDGHLRVVWANYNSEASETPELARYTLGLLVLLALLGAMAALLKMEPAQARR